MPLQATAGAATYDAFGGGPLGPFNYIEDVFQTFLYTGNGSTQTITNGIDLAGKGGLVWLKGRSGATEHRLYNIPPSGTAPSYQYLSSNSGNGWRSSGTGLTAFSSSGFSIGGDSNINASGATYVSWTLRKQQKFFDVLTYTGNGTSQTISHNLGSVPGCIVIKATDINNEPKTWQVYHRSIGNTQYLELNQTSAAATSSTRWNNTTPTAAVFTVGSDSTVNTAGETYVAYLFAHDAGGFGASGTDNVISCGSFTTDGSGNATVTLGYEPQWVLVKNTQTSGTSWVMLDNMRGWTMGNDSALLANLSNAENTGNNYGNPTATGFYINNNGGTWAASNTHIYIAIRRGPMRTPTTGTSVYEGVTYTGNATNPRTISTSNLSVVDATIVMPRSQTGESKSMGDRLRGGGRLFTDSTGAEITSPTIFQWSQQNGFVLPTNDSSTNGSASTYVADCFRRAPGFFDVVCYTGTGVAGLSVSHNLTVAPEMVIVKRRNTTGDWAVLLRNVDRLGAAGSSYLINTTAAWTSAGTYFSDSSGTFVPSTDATASVFRVSTATAVNASASTYVAYLFATVAGVSKVGSYTGTGTTLQIDCGFTAGARFVLVKRADSTGDWYVWDSARGIVAGNDSYLTLNTTAAEVTTTDWVDTYSAGFELSNAGGNNVNINGATYIFLSVA